MLLKKIIRLLGIVAMGLMMGSSINYAVKGYGLLGASGNWARLIAQSLASSSSSSSSGKVDCRDYDLTKYTCRAMESWTTEKIDVSTAGNGTGMFDWGGHKVNISGGAGGNTVSVIIKSPSCVSNEINICAKSFVMENKPVFSTAGGGGVHLEVKEP